MTIADESGSSGKLPNGNEAHTEVTASAEHPVANKEVNTEMQQPDHAKAEREEPDQPGAAAAGDESPAPAASAPEAESAAPSEAAQSSETAPVAQSEAPIEPAASSAAESSEPAPAAQSDPAAESATLAEPEQPVEPAKSTEATPSAETGQAAEAEPATEAAASSKATESTEAARAATSEPATESATLAEPEQAGPTETKPLTEASPAGESEPAAEAAASSEATESTEAAPPAQSAPATESAPPAEPEQPEESAKSTETALPAEKDPAAEAEPAAESAASSEAVESTETPVQADPPVESAPLPEAEKPSEGAKSAEPAPSAEPAAASEAAQSIEPVASAEPAPPVAPPAESKADTQKVSTLLLFVGAFVVFAVLIAVGAVLTLNRPNSDTATEPSAQQTPAPTFETRVMATMDSSAAGLKGNLTTKWDGMVNYNFVLEPDDPARRAAFALMVSAPPRPSSVRIQIKNADGVVVCFQDVFLKFDPRKAAAISGLPLQTPGGKPLSPKALEELKSKQEDQIARDEAAEAEREQGHSMFKLNTGPDGKVASISSQGEIACPQSLYESMGYWSFSADLPSPQEQTDWLNQQLGAHPEATEPKSPAVGAQEKAPVGNASQPGNFLMAGNDSIVSYDGGAGTIHTSTGKVFSIGKAGPAARAVAKTNLPAKIRYSCDRNSACTITESDGVVLHAHLSK